MTPSAKKIAAELFPDVEQQTILATLSKVGSGFTHAKSCHMYARMLYWSNGDMDRLLWLAEKGSETKGLNEYLDRWHKWHFIAQSEESHGLFVSFANAIRLVGPFAADFRIFVHQSHSPIYLSVNYESDPCLMVIPFLDDRVFVTTEMRSEPYDTEQRDGEFFDVGKAVAPICKCIESCFDRLSHFNMCDAIGEHS